ncbi:DUF4384 domain-containing protein [Thermodesulfobacteriota bacterium]
MKLEEILKMAAETQGEDVLREGDEPCPDFLVLDDFFEGRFGRKQHREMLEHMNQCDRCLHIAAEFERNRASMERSVAEENASASMLEWLWRWKWAFQVSIPVLAAAALVIFFGTTSISPQTSILVSSAYPLRGQGEFALKEGDTLYSGDGLRLEVTPNRNCYLYAYSLNNSGSPQQLFPGTGASRPTLFEKGETVRIPDGSWILDTRKGRESLFITADSKPLEDSDGLLSTIREAVSKGDTYEDRVSLLKDELEKRFTYVESLRFHHQ